MGRCLKGAFGDRKGGKLWTAAVPTVLTGFRVARYGTLNGECDLVNASRLEKRPASMPWPNCFASWLFAFTGRILLGVDPPTCALGVEPRAV